MNNGFIKLSRNINEWEFYNKTDYLLLWIELLRRASYKKTSYRGEELQPGEFTTSLSALSESTKLNTNSIHHKLKMMTKRGQIQQQTNRQRTKITILNWEKYQCVNTESTESKPKINKEVSKTKPIKKKEERNKKKEYIYSIQDYFPVSDEISNFFGPAPKVTLDRWKQIYPDEAFCDAAQNIMESIQNSKQTYKNYISTLNAWLKNNYATKTFYMESNTKQQAKTQAQIISDWFEEHAR